MPWRLLSFGVCFVLAQGILGAVLVPAFASLSRVVGEPVPAYPWVLLASVCAAMVVALRFVDDATWSSAGLGAASWQPRLVGEGFLLGASVMFATALLLWATGALHVDSIAKGFGDSASGVRAWNGASLRIVLLLAPAALWEELFFRGYLWSVADAAGGARMALWSTSVAFGAVHLSNPGASVRTTVMVILAGLCLGTIRERLHSVPAAWSAHAAWNVVMAAVLHVPVSGLAFATPGYRSVLAAPAWWSGGSWGPEGGIAAAVVLGGALVFTQLRSSGI